MTSIKFFLDDTTEYLSKTITSGLSLKEFWRPLSHEDIRYTPSTPNWLAFPIPHSERILPLMSQPANMNFGSPVVVTRMWLILRRNHFTTDFNAQFAQSHHKQCTGTSNRTCTLYKIKSKSVDDYRFTGNNIVLLGWNASWIAPSEDERTYYVFHVGHERLPSRCHWWDTIQHIHPCIETWRLR